MAIIDLVQWAPQSEGTVFAHKFKESNLSTFTQLLVHESQEAVLYSKGQVLGKFGPGKHTLNTENLPLLRKLYGFPFGGKNPFLAEIWFVNKIEPCDIDWEIDRMDIHDADYNTGLPLIARGRYGLRVKDAERFLIKIVGTKVEFNQSDLTRQFFGEFSTKTKSNLMQFMMNNGIGIKKISAYLDTISTHLLTVMNPFWENLGLELIQFYVTSIDIDESKEVGRRVLEAISRQSAQQIGGYTWQQSQAFEVAKDAVNGVSNNSGGLLGAVVAGQMLTGFGSGMLQKPEEQTGSISHQTGTATNAKQLREVFCSNCSKKFSTNNKFCPHCGDEYHPCPKCQTDNDIKSKRCVNCGIPLNSSMVLCPSCGKNTDAQSPFCGNCGKVLAENKCQKCGNLLDPSVKFCPKCGQKKIT